MRYDQMTPVPPLTKCTKTLIVTCVALYFANFVIVHLPQLFHGLDLNDYLGLVPARIAVDHWYWQFVSYIFLHGHPLHILLNMLILWYFGAEIELRIGTKDFLFFFFLCGIGAGVFNYAVNASMTSPALLTSPIVGASGAIFGILAAYGIFFGDRYFLVFFLFPLQARYFVLLIGAFELMLGVGASPADNVAHFAHVGGLFVGGAYIWLRYARPKGPKDGKGRPDPEREKLKKQFTLIVNQGKEKKDEPDEKYWN